jgi:hypothetical protein
MTDGHLAACDQAAQPTLPERPARIHSEKYNGWAGCEFDRDQNFAFASRRSFRPDN